MADNPMTALPTADDVRGVLAGVMDPELHVSITELGMVRDIAIGDDVPGKSNQELEDE